MAARDFRLCRRRRAASGSDVRDVARGAGVYRRARRRSARRPADGGVQGRTRRARRICERGLWGWSRHPNYFFEWLGWLGWPLLAIGAGYPWGWLSLLAPAWMYYLLVHISGVPPLEEAMRKSRGEAYADYAARVNAFWPAPPRSR